MSHEPRSRASSARPARKGWEFVGITGTDNDHYALFKRRRQAGGNSTEETAPESHGEALPTPEERKRNREQARG